MKNEREAFESWAYSKKWNIARVRDKALDQYVDDFVNGAWHGWQAKAQAVPEGFVLVPKEPTYEMLEAGSEARSRTEGHIASIWEAMIEAQEPASD